MKTVGASLAGVALLTSLAACSTDPTADPADTPAAEEGTYAVDENTLVFAILPDHEGAAADGQPIGDYIAHLTGKTVEVFPATDYVSVIEGLAAGKIDVAQISAFTYYQTKLREGAAMELLGGQITQEGSSDPGYYSVAVKHPDSDAQSLEDFAGQKVCFVNPTSTSGNLVPTAGLLDVGVTIPDEDRVYGEKHPATAALIAEGEQCKVGFAQDVDVDPLIASGALVEVSRVWVAPAPMVILAQLPQSVKDTLHAGLDDFGPDDVTGAGIELTQFLEESWYGFAKVEDSQYDIIKTMCEKMYDLVTACQA